MYLDQVLTLNLESDAPKWSTTSSMLFKRTLCCAAVPNTFHLSIAPELVPFLT